MKEKNKIVCARCLDKGYVDISDIERLNMYLEEGDCELCLKGKMKAKLSAIKKLELDKKNRLQVKVDNKKFTYLIVLLVSSFIFFSKFTYITIVCLLYLIAIILGKVIPNIPLGFKPIWLFNIIIIYGFILIWWINSIVIFIKSFWKIFDVYDELFQNSKRKLKYLGFFLFTSSSFFISNVFFHYHSKPLNPDNLILEFTKKYKYNLELGDLLFVFIPFIIGSYFVLQSLYNKKYNFED
jgi:hypothetical protein